ncbi:MAG: ABC transporter substrate-binding protein [Pseudomonadota bacterium]
MHPISRQHAQRRSPRAHLVALGAILITFTGLSACSPAPTTDIDDVGAGPTQDTDVPSTLRIGLEADLQGFDPLRTRLMGVSTLTVADAVFDTLITLDESGAIQPQLALSLEPAPDLRTWTMILREGVRFHDGTALDAAAVAHHFTRLIDPANRCACRPFLGPLQEVVVVSEYKLRFELSSPWAALPAVLGEPSVVSLIGSPASHEDGESFNRSPVGTGPYRFSQWRDGEAVVLERFDQYWAAQPDDAIARPATIEYRILPDQQGRLAALRAGDVDLIWTLDGSSAARAEVLGLRVVRRRGAGARLLVLNTRQAPFDDVRVRRALAHASDSAAYVAAVSEDGVLAAEDPFGPGSPFRCDAHWPAFDPEQAKRLLADYGEPVTVTFGHTATPRGQAAGQIFQQFWQAVGIDVTLQPTEQVQLVTSVFRRRFQVGPWRLRDSVDPDPDLYGLFHSASPFNVTGVASAELDELLAAARSTVDGAQRQEAYCALERYLADQVPYLYLGENTYFAIARADLAGALSLRGGLLSVRGIAAAPDATP